MAFRLSLAHFTVQDASPPELVEAAAAAGFRQVGLRLLPARPGEQPWPMAPGSAMLRETLARTRALGVQVHDVEVVRLGPALQLRQLAPALDAAQELGARWLVANVDEDDEARAAEQLAGVATAAAARGLRVGVEFMAYTALPTLQRACALVRRSAHPGARVLVDSLHLFRSGGSFETWAESPEVARAFAQVSDVLARPPAPPSLAEEARAHRLLPGEGEVPLVRLASALEADATLAVEAPNALRRDTLDATGRARLAMRKTRQWAQAHGVAVEEAA
ncbi:TIM barrel protein [Ramlibacter sp. G-1-2-2]|uniref:TIM barrel protein n=1 Tax=Ramlibacter agri TaxID=2728837 RepID=A0A848H8U2_9BURK|nr:TIM barrel protein [Ramlibacter agri]NML47396.1 TIM barrel protein [Ramlibacter agri]